MNIWSALAGVLVILIVALLLGIIAERLRQNALLGYLLSGVLLGPSVLGLVRQVEEVRQLAEVGVALLLFTIGLEFSLRRLRELGAVASLGGAAQILATGVVFALLALAFGRPLPEAVIIGAALSVSSTAVVLRVLVDRSELDSLHGRNALGILLTQDLAIVPLVLVISAVSEGADAVTALQNLAVRIGFVFLLVIIIYFASERLVPPLLSLASGRNNRELPVILAVATCLGATWASHAMGLSPTLGAFVAGVLLAESPFAEQIRADVGPLRAVFVTMFFASAGMLADLPRGRGLLLVLVAAVVILLVKSLLVGAVIRAFRQPRQVAFATGLALAQIGEFSFVLLQAGSDAGAVAPQTFQILLSASVLTLLVTPYLMAGSARLCEVLIGRWNAAPYVASAGQPGPAHDRKRVIVVGYGPAGRSVVESLRAAAIPLLVIDLNPKTVSENRSLIPIEIGDASRGDILQHHHLLWARAVVVTVPDPQTARLIIHQTRQAASQVPIIARGRYHIHIPRLKEAGADAIVDEEYVTGERLGAELLAALRKLEPGSP
jgi:CPA2 family monovalent cation:H+ antiporter-2